MQPRRGGEAGMDDDDRIALVLGIALLIFDLVVVFVILGFGAYSIFLIAKW
jgi:hypothetical protein